MTDYHKFITALAPDKLAIVRALRKAAQNVSKDVTEGVKLFLQGRQGLRRHNALQELRLGHFRPWF